MLLDRNISVQLEQFDGPLSLLLYLIQKEEMNLETLDLTKVTKQYLDFLKYMQELDFDMAGEYLYLAATLVWLKSKLTLEEKSDIENSEEFLNPMHIASQEELVKRLKALQCFQSIGKKFWDETLKVGDQVFTRARFDKKKVFSQFLRPSEQNDMISVMIDLLKRQRRKFALIKRDRISIKEKLKDLCSQLKVDNRYELSSLIKKPEDRIDVVITFISLLELARLRKLSLMQAEHQSEIYINVLSSLDNFDIESANGFEPVEDQNKEQKNNKDDLDNLHSIVIGKNEGDKDGTPVYQ